MARMTMSASGWGWRSTFKAALNSVPARTSGPTACGRRPAFPSRRRLVSMGGRVRVFSTHRSSGSGLNNAMIELNDDYRVKPPEPRPILRPVTLPAVETGDVLMEHIARIESLKIKLLRLPGLTELDRNDLFNDLDILRSALLKAAGASRSIRMPHLASNPPRAAAPAPWNSRWRASSDRVRASRNCCASFPELRPLISRC